MTRGRALAGVALVALALACERAEPRHAPDGPPRAKVTIGVHVIDAELADTPARQQRGLSGRPVLPPGQGMLFVYAEPALRAFWMPDMRFDIDIVWIRERRIVHVESDVPHAVEGKLPVYQPGEPADLVLEVPAGTARRLGWRVGDAVEVEHARR